MVENILAKRKRDRKAKLMADASKIDSKAEKQLAEYLSEPRPFFDTKTFQTVSKEKADNIIKKLQSFGVSVHSVTLPEEGQGFDKGYYWIHVSKPRGWKPGGNTLTSPQRRNKVRIGRTKMRITPPRPRIGR